MSAPNNVPKGQLSLDAAIKNVMRILLLTTFFPPANTVAAHRMFSFAEYLPEFGIDVTVLTVSRTGNLPKSPTRCNVVHLYREERPVNKFVPKRSTLRSLFRWTGMRPLRNYYLGKFTRALKRYMKEHNLGNYDAVLASYGPEDVLRAGEILHSQLGLPLIVDFRDPWLSNRYYAWNFLERKIIAALQRRIVNRSALVVTVSETLASLLRDETGVHEVAVIYNGYYEQSRVSGPRSSISKRSPADVCYCGSLYAGVQPIDIFLRALEENPRIRFRIALLDESDVRFVQDLSRRFGVEHQVEVVESLPYDTSLELQNETRVLLFLNRTDGSAKGVLTGKLFEYFSTGNFILGIGHPNDEAARLIQKYRNGVYVDTPEKVSHVLANLQSYQRPPSDMSFFTRKKQAQILADQISRVLQGN